MNEEEPVSVDAVVLAGRANTGGLAQDSDEELEANITIAGKPMVSYVLETLLALPQIGNVLLVGPKEGLSMHLGPRVFPVEPGGDLIDNVKAGLAGTSTEYVLVCASDIPLVTVDVMSHLLAECLRQGADFCYPVSTKEDCDRMFPGVHRTYLRLRDGTFTGGNVMFVRKEALVNAWPLIEKMLTYRKSPIKMASFLGFGLVIRVFLGLASVAEIEKRVYDMLSIKPKAIVGVSPQISVDVDKPSDLALCRSILGQ